MVAEVFAGRWTPIIVRNILYGCRGFNEIIDGAPGLSRSLLSRRLDELERAGLIRLRAEWQPPVGPGCSSSQALRICGACCPGWNRRPSLGAATERGR